MSISNLGSLALSIAIASAMVGSISNSSTANRPVISETELMTQNSNSRSNEIKKNDLGELILPDKVQQQVEEVEKKARQEQAERSARRMAQRTPKEREEMQKERKKLEEIERLPESRTEEEIKRDEEKAMDILNQLREKKKSE